VALELISMGFKKVYALKGGWEEWVNEKCPVEKK
jgi:rhodanese-related sulfurtransferase